MRQCLLTHRRFSPTESHFSKSASPFRRKTILLDHNTILVPSGENARYKLVTICSFMLYLKYENRMGKERGTKRGLVFRPGVIIMSLLMTTGRPAATSSRSASSINASCPAAEPLACIHNFSFDISLFKKNFNDWHRSCNYFGSHRFIGACAGAASPDRKLR
jgi:hypothetical protein